MINLNIIHTGGYQKFTDKKCIWLQKKIIKISSQKETSHIQIIVGSFLNHTFTVDNTIHPALRDVVASQVPHIHNIKDATIISIEYLDIYPNAANC